MIDLLRWIGRAVPHLLLFLAIGESAAIAEANIVQAPAIAPIVKVQRHNLSAGLTYECSPPPNYWGWKGPQHGDRGQLTDGRINAAWDVDGTELYAHLSTMGWNEMPPVVVFDLGQRRTIEGVGIHTALSWWGPWWPAEVAVFVSDDNVSFYMAAPPLRPASDALEPPTTEAIVQASIDRVMREKDLRPSMHWWRAEGLQATGRYVALFMTKHPDTGTIVVDEIEIYGHQEAASVDGRPEQVFSEGPGGVESYKLYHAIDQRLSRDLTTLRQKIDVAPIGEPARRELTQQLEILDDKRQTMPVPPTEGFEAVLPITSLHGEICALQAALWRSEGAPELRLWQTHRLDPLALFQPPAGATPELRIVMARNAVRSDVLNISSSDVHQTTVELELRNLPTDHLEVFEVPFVDTKDFEPVAAALVPATPVLGRHRIVVTPGMTRQIWLRCSSGDLAPGRHDGSIHLSSNGWSADVPVSIEVVSVEMPDRFSLYIGGWDYPWAGTYQVTERNLEEYLAMLQEYGVNTAWAANPFPHGTYDDAGKLIRTPSRKTADEWLELWPDAAMYCPVLFEILPVNEPYREEKYATWAEDWSAYMVNKGVEPDRIAMLIRDEPTTEEELRVILATGRAIKRGEPRFKIWNDIHYPDPLQAPAILDEVMREACDIQCFNVQHFLAVPDETRAFMAHHSRDGLQWWSYTGGGSHRLADPHVAWRLRFWLSYDLGLTGAHFWAFGDGTGGFSWNEYFNVGTTRSPLYLASDGITVGKSMEAMREGAQDYELLKMMERRGSERAIGELREDVSRVLTAHTEESWLWNAPKDRSGADAVRIEVLRKLAAMPSE